MISALGSLRRVHHLNCGSFAPWGLPQLVTHVLACEFGEGVVLVDAGLGQDDVAHPIRGFGLGVRALRPRLAQSHSAATQLEHLGYQRTDVKAIVATHLDYDHISGAADFPDASIHVTAAEMTAARCRSGLRGRMRYRKHHVDSVIDRIETYSAPTPTGLLNFRGHQLTDTGELILIPLPGHTVGHAAVAVRRPRSASNWLIHAGDAFMHHSTLEERPRRHRRLGQVERVLACDPRRFRGNHASLRQATRDGHQVICSHDRQLFESMTTVTRRQAFAT